MMQEFGVIGLGRMGGGLAWQALGKGMRVHGHDLYPPSQELLNAGLVNATTLEEFVAGMASPRKIFLYIHAGPPIDAMLDQLAPLLAEGDVIVDGGNSYWGDDIRRHARLAPKGIRLVDLGTSGGVEGARQGACFMVGGDPEALNLLNPILSQLCVSGGYVKTGGPGTGHFVKLVHNGIEFGMLQAIGEGVDLLTKFPGGHRQADVRLPILDILTCWQNGSVIRSWLIDLMHDGLKAKDEEAGGDPSATDQGTGAGLDAVPGYIEDTGEVNWLVGDAMRMEVPIPIIAGSVMELFASRDEKKTWARAIAIMRHGFGGHPFGPKVELQTEREVSRVGDIYRPTTDPSA